jgi:hypothetical protein
MTKYILSFTLVVFALFYSGCGDSDSVDTTRPTIEIVGPEDGAEFEPGDVINFSAIFRDNVELRSYRIQIHIDDDGHTHGRLKDVGEPFEYEATGEFNRGDREATINRDIPIPNNAAHGEYHLGVYCTDAAGNEAVQYIEFFLEDHDGE